MIHIRTAEIRSARAVDDDSQPEKQPWVKWSAGRELNLILIEGGAPPVDDADLPTGCENPEVSSKGRKEEAEEFAKDSRMKESSTATPSRALPVSS